MSADTMAAHDDGIEEAKVIVRKYLWLRSCGEPNCETCRCIRKRRRRILLALERAKEQKR